MTKLPFYVILLLVNMEEEGGCMYDSKAFYGYF